MAPFQESELLKSTGVPYKYFDGHALTEQAGVKLSNLKRWVDPVAAVTAIQCSLIEALVSMHNMSMLIPFSAG